MHWNTSTAESPGRCRQSRYSLIVVGTDDISIGPGKWIKWVELNPNDYNLFELDPFLLPIGSFWKNLENDCVAECCGIDAFTLWPEDISSASKNLNRDEIKNQLLRLKEAITETPQQIVNSEMLNNLFDKKVFIELIDHVLGCL